jgi:hypothetical protein
MWHLYAPRSVIGHPDNGAVNAQTVVLATNCRNACLLDFAVAELDYRMKSIGDTFSQTHLRQDQWVFGSNPYRHPNSLNVL